MTGRRHILALATVMVLVSPASGQARHVWDFLDSGQDLRLTFGVPDSHELTLSLICEPRRKRLLIISTVLPPKPAVGRTVTAKLSNGAASREYRGAIKLQTRPDRIHFFEATTAPNAGLFGLLKAGSSLTIDIAGARQDIPLRGVTAPLARMEKACPGSR